MSDETISNPIKRFFSNEYQALKTIYSLETQPNDKITKGMKVCRIIMCFLYISLLIATIVMIVYIIIKLTKLHNVDDKPNTSQTITNNNNTSKESMSPAQRIHLAKAYSKITSESNPRDNKYDTVLKNPSNEKRKIRNSKLYNNIEKAGNPTNVARGGVPMDYDKKAIQGKSSNMEALDNATFNGTYGNPNDSIGGKSDIVPYGNSPRMAGMNQDLSPFLGITSAKH